MKRREKPQAKEKRRRKGVRKKRRAGLESPSNPDLTRNKGALDMF